MHMCSRIRFSISLFCTGPLGTSPSLSLHTLLYCSVPATSTVKHAYSKKMANLTSLSTSKLHAAAYGATSYQYVSQRILPAASSRRNVIEIVLESLRLGSVQWHACSGQGQNILGLSLSLKLVSTGLEPLEGDWRAVNIDPAVIVSPKACLQCRWQKSVRGLSLSPPDESG